MEKCFHCNTINVQEDLCANCHRRYPRTELEQLIIYYFKKGYQYDSILKFLSSHHGFHISKSTLIRRLKENGIQRRRQSNTFNEFQRMERTIANEVTGPNSLLGYRLMWNQLKNVHGIYVTRSTVMNIMRVIDPAGVETRASRSLKRRTYVSLGPNYCWHLDGYDKLKPFGFSIHGCIDGYSRKMLWLKSLRSNKNPLLVANCYLKFLQDSNGKLPRLIRADHGSENVWVCTIQCFLRRIHNDPKSGENAFLFGTSQANQRQEAWWSILKRFNSSWIINFFKNMINNEEYDPGDRLQLACAQFVFGPLIEKNLDDIMSLWNHHYIRKSKHSFVHGRPNELFCFPEDGHCDQSFEADWDDLVDMVEYVKYQIDEDEENDIFEEYFIYLSTQLVIAKAKDWDTARINFLRLMEFARG